MSKEAVANLNKEPFAHISKRDDISFWKAWVIRLVAVLISLVVCAVVIFALTKLVCTMNKREEKKILWCRKVQWLSLKIHCTQLSICLLYTSGGGLQNRTPYLIAAVLKKSPEGYCGNGAYPLGCSI